MSERNGAGSVISLILWLIIQICVLGLCAFRIPLAISQPRATEQSALVVLLITQIGFASVIFPLLLRGRKFSLIAVLVAWPMAQMAAMLADVPAHRWIYGEAFVSAWLIALSLWTWAIPIKKQVFAAGVAAMFSLGGPVLWYLRAEFGEQGSGNPQIDWHHDLIYGPVFGVLSQFIPDQPMAASWLMPAVFIIFALILGLFRRYHGQSNRLINSAAINQV